MSFPEKVRSILWSIVEAMACDLTPFVKDPERNFTRNRKLSFIQLIRFLISMESGCLGHELMKFFNFDPAKTPTVSALIQQRSKLLPEAFRHVLLQFNSKFPLTKFRGKYFLIAVDGSEFNIARNPSDSSTFHEPNGKSKRGFNTIHTISLFDLISKRYLDVVVQPGRKKNEYSALCQLADRYDYGGVPIFVADRGFSSYNVFAHLMEKGFYFVIRAKDVNTMRLLGITDLPENMDQWTEVVLTRSHAKKKHLHPELEDLYRFVSKKVPFDFITDDNPEYRMRLRIVRFQIEDGKYENIITNLPDEEFTAEDIKDIFNCRWGIEISFRDLKHTIGTTNFHSKSPEYIEFEILCRMTLYNFCTIITMAIPVKKRTQKWVYQVNISMAIKICFAFLCGRATSQNIDVLIRQHILPVRPGRTFERRPRFQAPASFAYRFV